MRIYGGFATVIFDSPGDPGTIHGPFAGHVCGEHHGSCSEYRLDQTKRANAGGKPRNPHSIKYHSKPSQVFPKSIRKSPPNYPNTFWGVFQDADVSEQSDWNFEFPAWPGRKPPGDQNCNIGQAAESQLAARIESKVLWYAMIYVERHANPRRVGKNDRTAYYNSKFPGQIWDFLVVSKNV